MLAIVLIAGGCAGGIPTVKPEPVPEEPPPALVASQTERILSELGQEIAAQGEAGPAGGAGRMAGPALAMREAEYIYARAEEEAAKDKGEEPNPAASVVPMGTTFAGVIVPATDTWPRSFVAVTEPVDAQAPLLYVLTQENALSQYKLTMWVRLIAKTAVPAMAPAEKGAAQLPIERVDTLAIAPVAALEAYAAVKEDPIAPVPMPFSQEDPVRAGWYQHIDGWGTALADIKGTVEHSSTANLQGAVALETADGGALVFGTISSQLDLSFKRSSAGEFFELPERMAALGDGTTKVTKRAVVDFQQTVALVIPPVGSTAPIEVIGAFQVPIKVTVTQEEKS